MQKFSTVNRLFVFLSKIKSVLILSYAIVNAFVQETHAINSIKIYNSLVEQAGETVKEQVKNLSWNVDLLEFTNDLQSLIKKVNFTTQELTEMTGSNSIVYSKLVFDHWDLFELIDKAVNISWTLEMRSKEYEDIKNVIKTANEAFHAAEQALKTIERTFD